MNKKWEKPKPKYNIPLMIIGVVLFLGFVGTVFANLEVIEPTSEDVDSKQSTSEAAQSMAFSRSTTDNNSVEEYNDEDIIDVDYVDMWENYSDDEYQDKWVRIIGKIEKMQYMKNVYFKENIPEGLTNSLSITATDENEYENFSDGDYVVIVGKVKYKTFGTLSIESATIAKASDEDLTARENYESLRNTKKVQEINDYKNSAQTVSYESLIREPDKYKGEILKVTVKISQLMAGGILTEAGYRGYTSNDEWYIHYEIPSNVPRIIEKDTVTFYGEFAGLKTMTRALTGVSEYVPKLDAKYHVIN